MRSIGFGGCLFGACLIAAACSSPSAGSGDSGAASQGTAPAASGRSTAPADPNKDPGNTALTADAGEGDSGAPDSGAPGDGGATAGGLDVSGLDPEKPLYDTRQDLLSFVTVSNPESLRKRWKDPNDLLESTFGVGSVWLSNQGNTAISRPHGTRRACIDGLRGMVLQTPEQRRVCGADYMVPIYKDGKADSAKTCIDVFEFPNRPCELPVVWISPSRANEVCQIEGKRLCTQDEWVLACRGSPEGDLQDYAYGNDLDLTACHTRGQRSGKCDPTTVKTTWATCASDTAPAGSFPRCRSRFGVFDQHGNVAEIMKRWDPDRERTVTQLKGSAFFYEPISMRPTDPPNKAKYPDHCAHDPRWHVENLDKAGHMMYHLGFRCCKDVGGGDKAQAP